jgi:hypothetical protein
MTEKKKRSRNKKSIDEEYEIREILKLRDFENKAKIMIKDFKNIRLKMEYAENDKIRVSEEKKLDELLKKRDGLVKRIIAQRKVVADLTKKVSNEDSD